MSRSFAPTDELQPETYHSLKISLRAASSTMSKAQVLELADELHAALRERSALERGVATEADLKPISSPR